MRTGSMSRKIEFVEDDAGKVTKYLRHPNGGGLIGPGAEVDETSFIGSTTYVEAGAHVGPGCKIGAGGWIDRKARIGDHAFIGNGVYVGQDAIVGRRAHIGSHSRIGAGARVGEGMRLRGDTVVPDGELVEAASAKAAQKASPRGERSRLAA
jgi:UDP-3-O-[3-hydroxymyristoyl] glucosamine N-acyltransferase